MNVKETPTLKSFQTLRKAKAWLKYKLFFFRKHRVYMYVDFDITAALPRSAILVCEKICKKLKDLNIIIRPSDGTLLGLLRDGCLIRHDNDLDFDILATNDSVEAFRNGFDATYLTLVRKVTYRNRLQQLTYRDKEGILIDFIFWWGDRNLLVNFSEAGYMRVLPRKFLAELKNQIIDGASFQFGYSGRFIKDLECEKNVVFQSLSFEQ